MINEMKVEFKKHFGDVETRTFFSPGRVNLIGEHIDYNGGYVFPCALDIGTFAIVSNRDDDNFSFYSMNFSDFGVISRNIYDMEYNKDDNWANYLKGILYNIKKDYDITHGLNILINGNIPNSSGLSSSASIELLMGVILNNIFELNIPQIDLVKIGQKTENTYIGVNCGIMDQFAIGMCEENKAVFLNTSTLEYDSVPLDMSGYKIVIGNTKVKRGLADSKYNERRSECDQALEIIKRKFDVTNLCDTTIEQLDALKDSFPSETIYNRAKHSITENLRTISAKNLLEQGDLVGFGKLLSESHYSLKNDYEVSCKELDILVNLVMENGAIGARMTGAGFGGCIVSIVPEDKISALKEVVEKKYKELTGLVGEIYVATSGSGSREIFE